MDNTINSLAEIKRLCKMVPGDHYYRTVNGSCQVQVEAKTPELNLAIVNLPSDIITVYSDGKYYAVISHPQGKMDLYILR